MDTSSYNPVNIERAVFDWRVCLCGWRQGGLASVSVKCAMEYYSWTIVPKWWRPQKLTIWVSRSDSNIGQLQHLRADAQASALRCRIYYWLHSRSFVLLSSAVTKWLLTSDSARIAKLSLSEGWTKKTSSTLGKLIMKEPGRSSLLSVSWICVHRVRVKMLNRALKLYFALSQYPLYMLSLLLLSFFDGYQLRFVCSVWHLVVGSSMVGWIQICFVCFCTM